MKDLLKILFLLLIFCLTYIYRDSITGYIFDNIIYKNKNFVTTPNEYSLDYDLKYVKKTDNFSANNKQEILNIFFTALNNGEDNFYLICNYDDCEKDVNYIAENNIFATINNFVHPYNTYRNMYIKVSSWGKISFEFKKAYSKYEIIQINNKLEKIIKNIIKDDMTDRQKIKAFHDYIINTTKYDSDYIKNNLDDNSNPSHRASGPLLRGRALCGGYSQAMSLFLNYLKIPNYRISSEAHIWNLVYLDNKWYHLDLTWDDPVTSDNSDLLLDKYFLISTNQLEKYNTGSHVFNKNIYLETSRSY